MINISELRARIANGDIKTGGAHTPKVGAGTFTVLVTESAYGKGNNGNPRIMMTCKVLSGGTDAEVGGEFRYYIATVNQEYLQRSIAEWSEILVTKLGIPEDRLWQDAEETLDVVSNIATLANKLAIKGKLKLVIDRPLQKDKLGNPKLDSKGHQQYYNNIKEVVVVSDADAVAPAATNATPLPPGMPAPAAVTPAVTPEPTTVKKQW